MAYWKYSKEWYAALLLPTGRLEPVGISGSIEDTGLLSSIPTCYRTKGKEICGWKPNFMAGGSKITKRSFAIMYLLDDLNIPREGSFEVPQRALFDWVAAKDLRSFDSKDIAGRVYGYQAAKAFSSRLKFMREKEILGCTMGEVEYASGG